MARVRDNPKADKLKREGFVSKLDSLFDISCPDSENMIKGDKLRSKQAVQEDIKFIKDQRGDRKMSIGKRDEDYDRCIGKKVVRDSRAERMTTKASSKSLDSENNNRQAEDIDQEDSSDSESDDKFEIVEKKKRRSLI